jgi:carboxypeptidase PM20D1
LFPFAQRAVFANLWLTRRLVIRNLEDSPTTNAMVRTTTAATIFQAGTKDNVLPSQARAVLNFRILPGDTIDGVMEHVRKVVHDSRVEARIAGHFSAEPSAVSNVESPSFAKLEQTIRSTAAEAIVAPYLVVVVTDARYYADLSRNVFRFLPLRLTADDLKRMHGADERIAISNYEGAIRMYRELIINAAGSSSPADLAKSAVSPNLLFHTTLT